MALASRVRAARESATIRMTRRARELERQGHRLIDLGAGEPSVRSPLVAVAAAHRALDSGDTRYTSVDGSADLRQAIAEHYAARGGPWTGDGDVLVTVGAKSALAAAMLALVDPGDEVVLPTPWWVSLPAQVRLAGGVPVAVPMEADRQFALRADSLIAACTERTKAILINSPCNPTGAVMPSCEAEKLLEAVVERDLLLIVDATYERFDYRARADSPLEELAARYPAHVLWISSMSKAYAMTGWRIGYALGDPRWIAGLRAVQSHTTTHPTSFAMAGSAAALRDAEADVESLVAHCARQRDRAVNALRSVEGVVCHRPEGAFYLLLDLRPLTSREGGRGIDSDGFCEGLLEHHGVVTVSGSAFDAPDFVRLSYAVDEATLDEGLDRIAAFAGALEQGRVGVERAS